MALIGSIPRRAVNLPPGALRTLLGCAMSGTVQEGPALEAAFTEPINPPAEKTAAPA